jgi:predicted nucleic acid-binding protein
MEVLDLIAAVGGQVFSAVSLPVCSDPDDNCFLECAEAARAEYLITGNTKHFPQESPANEGGDRAAATGTVRPFMMAGESRATKNDV